MSWHLIHPDEPTQNSTAITLRNRGPRVDDQDGKPGKIALGTPIYTVEIAATDPGRRQRVVAPHLRLVRPSRKHAAIAHPRGPSQLEPRHHGTAKTRASLRLVIAVEFIRLNETPTLWVPNA